jgi:hypothetical protein
MKPHRAVMGFAAAMLLAFAAAPAHAGPGAKCSEKQNSSVDHIGTDGSECSASSDGTGTAKSKASGATSSADAEVQTGGKANAVATGGSQSEALSDTGGHATSHASGGGSDGFVESHGHGVAKGNATGGGQTDAVADGKCNASAKAAGSGSYAQSRCGANGSFAHATATGGGAAIAWDNALPTCTPGSGTAKVRSSGGNCP